MRYLIALALLTTTFASSFGQSPCQTIIGITGGINPTTEHYQNLEVERAATGPGTHFGVLLAQRLSPHLTLGMEPTFMRRQLRYDPHFETTASLRLTTFRFPVLVELRPTPSALPFYAALQLGGAAGLGLRLERLEDGTYTSVPTPSREAPESYNLLDVGLQYGLKVGYGTGDVEVFARALRYDGFVDIARGIRSRTSGLQLSMGVAYRYARRR